MIFFVVVVDVFINEFVLVGNLQFMMCNRLIVMISQVLYVLMQNLIDFGFDLAPSLFHEGGIVVGLMV